VQAVVRERDRGDWRGARRRAVQARGRAAFALLALLVVSVGPALAHAQPRVVAFPTRAESDERKADVDRALLEALKARDDVELAPSPALDLEAFQLAIDCSATSASCLREVAERTNGEVLLAPRLERRSQHVELRIMYFSAKEGTTRYAAHKEHGRRAGSETLAAIPGLLDELFASSKPETAPAPETTPDPAPADQLPAPETAAAESTVDASVTSEAASGLPAAPLIVAGGGVLMIGAGIAVGAIAKGTEDDYAKQPVTNAAQAEQADSLRERGKRQALIANVLLGAGAAVAAAGGVWLLLSVGKVGKASQTAVIPELGPDRAALHVSGRWSGL